MSECRLRMAGVRKRFGATEALRGVDLEVETGQVHALVGENGAGKSTLMKVLSGAVQPDSGAVFLDGIRFAPRDPRQARARGVAMIYQELSLAPHMTVQDNLLLGAEPARFGWRNRLEGRSRAAAALARVGLPEELLGRAVHALPPASQQLVEVARAVGAGCRVLVLDEPTSSLGQADVERLLALVEQLRGEGLALVYISHVLEEVERIADRCSVLRDGAIVDSRAMGSWTKATIVEAMVGRAVTELYPRSARVEGEVVMELAGLAGASLPAEASLTLRRGEVLGIAGLVGAGRTELLRCVFGLDRVERGMLSVLGVAGARPPSTRWAQGVGMVSEDRASEGLAIDASVIDNLVLARLDGLGPCGLVWPGRCRVAAQRWIDRLGIRVADPCLPVGALSGGNQQKVALARLLHAGVDVLFLDEPTRGVDVGAKAALYAEIDRLAAGRGGHAPAAVLVVSSYLPELMGICDRVAVMCRGRLSRTFPVAETDAHRLMALATGAGGAA